MPEALALVRVQALITGELTPRFVHPLVAIATLVTRHQQQQQQQRRCRHGDKLPLPVSAIAHLQVEKKKMGVLFSFPKVAVEPMKNKPVCFETWHNAQFEVL